MVYHCGACGRFVIFYDGPLCPNCGRYSRLDLGTQISSLSLGSGTAPPPFKGTGVPNPGAGPLLGQQPESGSNMHTHANRNQFNPHPPVEQQPPAQSSNPPGEESIDDMIEELFRQCRMEDAEVEVETTKTPDLPPAEKPKSESSSSDEEEAFFDALEFPTVFTKTRGKQSYATTLAARGAGAAKASPLVDDEFKAYPPTLPCTKDHPHRWPRDQYPLGKHPEGSMVLKDFPVARPCPNDNVRHPRDDCKQLQDHHQVWARRGTAGARCEIKNCRNPRNHTSDEHGKGHHLDHPENPQKFPGDLGRYKREYPRGLRLQPLSKVYILGEEAGYKYPCDDPSIAPRLPDKYRISGLGQGLLDTSLGLHYSLEAIIAKLEGLPVPVYDAHKHPKGNGKPKGTRKGRHLKPDRGQQGSLPPPPPPPEPPTTAADAFGGLKVPPGLPSPQYALDRVEWFPEDFVNAMAKCLPPSQGSELGRLKQTHGRDLTALQGSQDPDPLLRLACQCSVQKAWLIYKVYIPYWNDDKVWYPADELISKLLKQDIGYPSKMLRPDVPTRKSDLLDDGPRPEGRVFEVWNGTVDDWPSTGDVEGTSIGVRPTKDEHVVHHFGWFIVMAEVQLAPKKTTHYLGWFDRYCERMCDFMESTMPDDAKLVKKILDAIKRDTATMFFVLSTHTEDLKDMSPLMSNFTLFEGRINSSYDSLDSRLVTEYASFSKEHGRIEKELAEYVDKGSVDPDLLDILHDLVQGYMSPGRSDLRAILPRLAYPRWYTVEWKELQDAEAAEAEEARAKAEADAERKKTEAAAGTSEAPAKEKPKGHTRPALRLTFGTSQKALKEAKKQKKKDPAWGRPDGEGDDGKMS